MDKKIEPQAAPKSVKKISEANLSVCVNADKLRRAKLGVYGGAKPGTNEITLAQKFAAQYEGDALVMEVYKGMLGLVDPVRAAKNRENEKKAALRRASR